MKAQRSNTTGVRLLYLFLSLATCCWFLYVFQRNLPDLGFHTIQPIVRGFGRTISGIAGRFGLDVLWAPCIWISAYIWGKKLLARIGLALETSIERLWLCTTAGLGVISMLAFALAAVRMFHRDEAYALVLLPIIFWFGETRRIVIAIYRRVQHRAGSQQFSARTAAHAFLTAYISVVLGIVFVSALGPELDYDPLVMHLFAAKAIAQEHMLKALPDVPQTFFPKNITMLFSVGLLLHSQILSRLLDFSFGLLVLLGAYCFATKHLSRTAGLLAAAILAATPLFVWEMRTAHLDCGSVLDISGSLFRS